MSDSDLFSFIFGKGDTLPLLALVVWAEMRFLPLVLDAIGWNRAIGAKLNVSDAEMQSHRPTSLFKRAFRRPPNGGPPPAAVVLLFAAILFASGCAPDGAASQWATPDGVTAIVLLVTTVLGFVATLLQRAGKNEWAEKARQAEAHAQTAAKVAGVVVKGLERAKGRLDPRAVTELVQVLREENQAAGVEDVVRPILADVRDGAPPEVAVRSATTRHTRRVS